MAGNNHEQQSSSGHPPAVITKLDRVKFLTHEVKSSVKERLHHDDDEQTTRQDDLFEDAAFDPQRVLQVEAKAKVPFRTRLSIRARNFAGIVKNPKAASRNNYTRHAAAKISNHPHDGTTKFDDELIDAHDALAEAKERLELSTQPELANANGTTNTAELDSALERVQSIEQKRDDLRSGWILGRQVVRAKVVRRMVSRPDREQFLIEPDQPGQPARLQWERYLGHLLLWYTNSFTAHRIDDFDEPPFDLRELAMALERLAAISTPWQSFFYKCRDVYRWEDPKRTTQIMLVYWVLWYSQQMAAFGIAFIIYITIRNKMYPSTVQAVRERIERAQDQTARVHAWGELIQKHGEHDWVEPLLDGVGPLLQMQFGDLTTFLERLQNFYRWERPRQTWWTLCVFLSFFLVSLLISMELFVRLLGLGAGCYFFYSFPIATNYPKYRHLVSPWCWVFWAIPDAAELAIMQLQEKTVVRDATRLAGLEREDRMIITPSAVSRPEHEPDTSSDKTLVDYENIAALPPDSPIIPTRLHDIRSSDTLTFRAVLLPNHEPISISLSRTHITLNPFKRPPVSHPYTSLLEIRKIDINTASNQTSSSGDTNTISRSSHIMKWLEDATKIQLLPDGLGFVFLQEDAEGSNHLSDLQYGQIVSKTPDHASTKAPDLSPPPIHPTLQRFQTSPESKPRQPNEHQSHKMEFSLIVNKSDRDKIFTVILGWSDLRWQPLYSLNRQNRLGHRGKKGEGNSNLDDAIKKALS